MPHPTEPVERIRAELLDACDRRMIDLVRSPATSPSRVKSGMYAGRKILESEPVCAPASVWLANVLARFEETRERLYANPDDEDGWALGGLRAIQNDVERMLERHRR